MDMLDKEMEILLNGDIPFEKYRNKTFLITGATGLIGSLLVKSLLFINNKEKLKIKVLAAIRDEVKAYNILGRYYKDECLNFVKVDLGTSPVCIDADVDYIIHAASVTESKYMVTNPVETIRVAVNGTEDILSLAVNKKVLGMVYISSMEIYGQPNKSGKIDENDLGYIDLRMVRSCYPESKRICETLCTAYASEYGVKVKSARLAQTFGVGVLPTDNRVFAQFARSVIKKKNIVLHTDGSSEGNYVYTIDAIRGILLLLTEGEIGKSYNISNEQAHTTIKGMAEMVAHKICNDNISVIVDIPGKSMGYAPKVKLWLNSSRIRHIGWYATVGLEDTYRKMIKWLKILDNDN